MPASPLYSDHNASTPVDPLVMQRFTEAELSCQANPGSVHAAGRRARAVLEDSRAAVAAALGVAVDHVTFVSGGTEANNTAVLGLGDLREPVLLAPLEHPSVLEPAKRRGVVAWRVDGDGRAIIEPPDRTVGLCCLVHGQSELGTLQPVEAAGRLAGDLGVPLHVDAAQTLGREPLETVLEWAETVAFSGHKVGGLRGASVLISSRRFELRSLLCGGLQESSRRAGTPSPALAAATALAIERAVEQRVERSDRMRAARDAFVAAIRHQLDLVRVLTPEDSIPNTTMLLFEGIDGRNLLPALDLAHVQASHGSACSSGSPEPPPILTAIGLSEEDARRCVRFSFAHTTSFEDAEEGAARVIEVVARLQRVARS